MKGIAHFGMKGNMIPNPSNGGSGIRLKKIEVI